MPLKTQLDALLNKEMDRKDFLRNVVIGVVALTGLGGALRLLVGQDTPKSSTTLNNGYSSSSYGGKK